jgi:hypothetical protein
MMSEPSIRCPSCKMEILLTESLAAPLLEATQRECENRLHKQEQSMQERETLVRQQLVDVAQAKEQVEAHVNERLHAERQKISAEEAKKAKQLLHQELEQRALELHELQTVLKQRTEKLAEAQQAQIELSRKEREIEDERREMELTIERRVQDLMFVTRAKAQKETEERMQLKVMEKEQTIESMKRQIEDLKQKAEQGSQQLQGEVLEIQLEGLLKAKFPRDTVAPVPKGQFGGDVVQHIFSDFGQCCGSILWESKRTKNWSDGWLAKLRDDQRAAKAECAIIVTQVLPRDVEHFDLIEKVWVTSIRTAIPVALALRHALIELAGARQAREGQQTKMEMVYQYLTGPRFRQRVQAIVEKFAALQDDLQKERKYLMQKWAAREQQIQGAIDATLGMYGDLEGIAGSSLQEIEGLNGKLLADD